jgi:hypothetical protein
LGSEQSKHRRFPQRLMLYRPGEETIILLTDLLDATRFPAANLLDFHLTCWSIEQVFQQIRPYSEYKANRMRRQALRAFGFADFVQAR